VREVTLWDFPEAGLRVARGQTDGQNTPLADRCGVEQDPGDHEACADDCVRLGDHEIQPTQHHPNVSRQSSEQQQNDQNSVDRGVREAGGDPVRDGDDVQREEHSKREEGNRTLVWLHPAHQDDNEQQFEQRAECHMRRNKVRGVGD